jgi:hypothetical protein
LAIARRAAEVKERRAIFSANANANANADTPADVKAKSCDDKYPAERSGLACAVSTKRQQEVNGKYHKKAGRET